MGKQFYIASQEPGYGIAEPETGRVGEYFGTGVPNRFDMEPDPPRPHPQSTQGRAHPKRHLGQSCRDADVMGSLPGGETGPPERIKSGELIPVHLPPDGPRGIDREWRLDPRSIPSTAIQPQVTNPEGGRQSKTLGRFDLVPGEPIVRMAQVLAHGVTEVPGVREGYPIGNWKRIPGYEHINHALEHLAMFQMGRTDEDHLGHAFTRLAFAIWADVNRADMHAIEPLGH